MPIAGRGNSLLTHDSGGKFLSSPPLTYTQYATPAPSEEEDHACLSFSPPVCWLAPLPSRVPETAASTHSSAAPVAQVSSVAVAPARCSTHDAPIGASTFAPASTAPNQPRISPRWLGGTAASGTAYGCNRQTDGGGGGDSSSSSSRCWLRQFGEGAPQAVGEAGWKTEGSRAQRTKAGRQAGQRRLGVTLVPAKASGRRSL
jgi:hypothetical protein